MGLTKYTEVTPDDSDVFAFLCLHVGSINLLHLPIKMWVARQDDKIIALLMLKTVPYTSLDLIVADPTARPFMRIIKLWRIAEAWLKSHNVPIICISIRDDSAHFQSLIRRLGFTVIAAYGKQDDCADETIFAKRFIINNKNEAVA